jgi:thiol-disulfide isomerase/thioredoxin
MKKILKITLILTAIFITKIGFAQPFIVQGKWERTARNVNEVVLYQIISGRLDRVATAQLQPDLSFVIAHTPPKEGFFVIGTGNPRMREDKFTFYLKPGDQLNFVVNDTSYTLTGTNTPENIAMKQWHDLIQPMEWNSFYSLRTTQLWTYVEFFPLLENTLQTIGRTTFQPTGNKTFDAAFAKYREFYFMHNALHFTQTQRSAFPETEEFPDYYRTLKIEKILANTDILIFPYPFYPSVFQMEYRFKGEKIETNPYETMIGLAQNDTVKGEIFLTFIFHGIRELAKMQEANAKFAKFIVTDDQKTRFEQNVDRVNKLHLEQGIGRPGLAWTYKDVNGNDVSFSDFKGKVVYVDVWATWCGPCRAELPHKKRVQEHFKGNPNIVFVGISTDAPKDIQKWKDFVVANELSPPQLHGNIEGPMHIGRLYDITGIPRFLLFDKQGNIVSAEAPRPSSAEIIPLLEQLLK